MWLVAANTNSCRIFLYETGDEKLTLVKELSNPLAKLKGTELVTDKPGHYGAEGGARGAFVERTTPHQNEVEVFSLEVARAIESGKNANQFKSVIIAAQPQMSGSINKHLNGHLKDCDVKNIVKDFTHLTEKELLAVLKEI